MKSTKSIKSGTILVYNCTDPKFAKLRQIFAMLRLRMRFIQPNQYHLSLLQLARGEGEAVENPEVEPITENILVFCGLNRAFLNQVLEVIRLAKMPEIHFKAILTTNNQDWTSKQLVEELYKEKEEIAAKATKLKEELEKVKNGEASVAEAAEEAAAKSAGEETVEEAVEPVKEEPVQETVETTGKAVEEETAQESACKETVQETAKKPIVRRTVKKPSEKPVKRPARVSGKKTKAD